MVTLDCVLKTFTNTFHELDRQNNHLVTTERVKNKNNCTSTKTSLCNQLW